jgi:hypothetical protein
MPLFCLWSSWYRNPLTSRTSRPCPFHLPQRDADVLGLDAAREGHNSVLEQGRCYRGFLVRSPNHTSPSHLRLHCHQREGVDLWQVKNQRVVSSSIIAHLGNIKYP